MRKLALAFFSVVAINQIFPRRYRGKIRKKRNAAGRMNHKLTE
jgi:hypothetical protein